MNTHIVMPDYLQAEGDHSVPSRWGASVNEACTRWLEKRGLLAAQFNPKFDAAQRNVARTRRKMARPE